MNAMRHKRRGRSIGAIVPPVADYDVRRVFMPKR